MKRPRQLSYLASFYTVELSHLGRRGFLDWLKDSFNDVVPAPKAPHFYTEDLETDTYGEVFAKIAHELDDTAREIASFGILGALEKHPPKAGTYEGLFSLVRMAESLRLHKALDSIHSILSARLPRVAEQRHLPDTALEIYCLRETLECLFRLTLENPELLGKHCEWAFNLLTIEMMPPSLNPVIAPAFVLARRHVSGLNYSVAQTKILEDKLENTLRSGFYKDDAPFGESYQFPVDGEMYPYDLEGILNRIDEWVRPEHRRSRRSLRMQYSRALPSPQSIPSATMANSAGQSDSLPGKALLDVRTIELEGA